MIDNELLLAISGLLDTKLEPIKADIKQLKLDNENMVNYSPLNTLSGV